MPYVTTNITNDESAIHTTMSDNYISTDNMSMATMLIMTNTNRDANTNTTIAVNNMTNADTHATINTMKTTMLMHKPNTMIHHNTNAHDE